jgi:outer membrane protein OmpA-like peptidoglycan-associated protein
MKLVTGLLATVTLISAQSMVRETYARGQRALQEKRYGDAVQAFDEALGAAPPTDKALLAGLHYYKGAALGMDGKLLPALASVELALRYAPQEASYQKLLARLRKQAASTIIPADQISRALLSARSFAAEQGGAASIDLWVNYQFDKDSLSNDGRTQAAELAKAINSPALAGMRFRLIGHTDSQGTEDYNQNLSERRAARLAEYLSSTHGVRANRLSAEGRGERELKVPGDNDEAHAVNRRVEVQVVE